MTNNKSTKRALFASAMALLLCFSMLLGTTYAWFTDSVTSSGNKIVAGTLEVDLLMADANGRYDSIADEVAAIFGEGSLAQNNAQETLWEPGKTQIVYLGVENKGSLDLKYNIAIDVVDGGLIGSLEYAIVDGAKYGEITASDWETIKANAQTGDIVAGTTVAAPNGAIKADEDIEYFALAVHMKEDADNKYQGKDVTIDITVLATQLASEKDSFGDDYDYDAPIVSAPINRPNAPVTVKGSQDVMIGLSQEAVDKLPSNVEKIAVSISEPKFDTAANTITFDSIELVDQNGDIIDLESLNLTDKITVTLPAQTTFAKGTPVMIYHDGELVANAVVGENGVISYDVAHLCEVTIGTLEEPSVDAATGNIEIGSVSELFWFAQSVNAGESYAGKTVVLTSDIDLNRADWTPIGSWENSFAGAFDGQGYTISNLYINAPEVEGVGFFGVTDKVTIKNVNFENVDVYGYSEVAAVAGYAHVGSTIENCHVSGEIKIVAEYAYAGGISAGQSYYSVDNCSVIADGTGLIQAKERNAVGGIVAWMCEGANKITNCQAKNLELIGWTNIGGISGFIHYSNIIDGCTVENVDIVKTRVGGAPGFGAIAGGYSYNASKACTITNNTAKDVTMTGVSKEYAKASKLYGSEYGGAADANFVLENNIEENVVENNIVADKFVASAAELQTAFANGGYIALTADVVLGEKVTIPAGKEITLDLGGFKLAGAFDNKGGSALIDNSGSLTVKNGTIVSLAEYPDVDWGTEGFPTYATNTISNKGVLIIEDGAVVENQTAVGGASYAVDNYAGATLTVNGGTIKAQDVAIRMFSGSATSENKVVINGGTITGKRAVWVQLPSSNSAVAPKTTLEINGGELTGDSGLAIYSYSYGNSFANTNVTITGGTFNGDVAFGGGYKGDQENVSVTGGTFSGSLGRYLANDGWVDIVKP